MASSLHGGVRRHLPGAAAGRSDDPMYLAARS